MFFLRFTAAFALCLMLFCAGIAWPVQAADQARAKPLHIKMNSAKASSARGIKIHRGNMPSSPQAHYRATGPRKGMDPDRPVDAAMTCAMMRNAAMSPARVKNIADSLKAYLRAEKADPALIDILLEVSEKTETDFELLALKAMLESDLGRNTTNPTSTARGVFQYIETTWLSLMARYGERIGHKDYAESIKFDAITKEPYVDRLSRHSRAEILKLRFDTRVSAMIKAYQMKDETPLMEIFKDSKKLSATDHYIAHMMGLGMAKDFYALKNQESDKILTHSGNPLFREAAILNPAFFYDEKGAALTAPQAYQNFTSRIAATYKRLRKIETDYGLMKNIESDCAQEPAAPAPVTAEAEVKMDMGPHMPAVQPAKVEKPEMLPAKGLSLAAAG
jgi:hypothetical protein